MVISNEKSVGSPAIAQFKGQMYIAWTGTNSAHNINVANIDENLNIVNKSVWPETSWCAPTLVNIGDEQMWLIWIGTGNKWLNWCITKDGANWGPKTVTHEVLNSSLSATMANGAMFVAAVENNAHIALNRLFK